MMKMKLIKLVLFAIVAIGISSCEDILDENPKSFYTESNFYTSIENAELAVLGAYSTLPGGDLYGSNLSIGFNYDTDVAQYNTSYTVNKMLESNAKYYLNPNNRVYERTWAALYAGIQSANSVIVNIQKMDAYKNGTDEEITTLHQYMGEVLFLRGLLYFNLVRNWGDVPLILEPVKNGDNFFVERTATEVVYDQIIADLEESVKFLPAASSMSTNERPSKTTAQGILARVALHAGGYYLTPNAEVKRNANYTEFYKKALLACDAIITSDEHGLHETVEKVFYDYHKFINDSKESMYEIPFFATDGSSGGVIGQFIGVNQHVRSGKGKATGRVKALYNFYQSYADDDNARKELTIATYSWNKKGQKVDVSEDQYSCGKWRRHWILDFNGAFSHNNVNNTNLNWNVLRYSDVLLMYAEAYHECEKFGLTVTLESGYDQYDAINEVRGRAGVDLITTTNVDDKAANSAFTYGDLPDNFTIVLRDERAWELAFEGHRKYDLKRWNSLGAAIKATYTKLTALYEDYPYDAGKEFDENKDELLPIPKRELSKNTGLIPNPAN